MKNALLMALLLISLTAFSQKKNSRIPVKDSTVAQKQDTAKSVKDTSAHLYGLAMPQQNWEALINLIKNADEKPSIIKDWIAFIINNAKEITAISESKKTK